MRKLLSSGLAVFTGVVCTPLVVSPLQMHKTPVPEFRIDQRLQILRSFFQQFGCPARDYAHLFLEASDAYGNNLFGWDNGKAHFPTLAAGIHEVGYQLSHARRFRAKDLNHLLATYNPSESYIERVKSVMRQISPTE